jgi:hypothetical protein
LGFICQLHHSPGANFSAAAKHQRAEGPLPIDTISLYKIPFIPGCIPEYEKAKKGV